MFGFFKKRPKEETGHPETVQESELTPPRAAAEPASTGMVGGGQDASPGGEISISLDGIVCVLPEEIKSQKVGRIPPNVKISIPLSQIIPQLSQGSVRVAFGIIRTQSPPQSFIMDGSFDSMQVPLPLLEIVPQLTSEHLQRRRGQTEVSVGEDIPNVFGPKGLTIPTHEEVKRPAPVSQRAAPSPLKDSQKEESAPMAPITMASEPSSPTPRHESVAPEPSRPITMPSLSGPLKAPESTIASSSASPSAQKAQTSIAEESGAMIQVPLAQICAEWPEALLKTFTSESFQSATLDVPTRFVEPGMKKGKLAFTWAHVRHWIRPVSNLSFAVSEQQELELPLSVVVPIFLQSDQAKVRGKDLHVREDIPELFENKRPTFGVEKKAEPKPSPDPEPSAPPLPRPSAEETVEPTAVKPEETEEEATEDAESPSMEFSALLGQPGKTEWNLNEIAEAAKKLASAKVLIITLNDGLPIASVFDEEMDPNPVAGLLPHLFNNATRLAKTLNIDPKGCLRVQFGDQRIDVLNHGKVFMGWVSNEDCTSPVGDLRKIVEQLSTQFK